MTKSFVEAEHIDDEHITSEISDEALERAAGTMKVAGGAFTVAFCSGLDTCPA